MIDLEIVNTISFDANEIASTIPEGINYLSNIDNLGFAEQGIVSLYDNRIYSSVDKFVNENIVDIEKFKKILSFVLKSDKKIFETSSFFYNKLDITKTFNNDIEKFSYITERVNSLKSNIDYLRQFIVIEDFDFNIIPNEIESIRQKCIDYNNSLQ